MRLLGQLHVSHVLLMLSSFSLLLVIPVISTSGESLENNLPPPSPPATEHPVLHAMSWIPKPSVVYENQPTAIEFKVRSDEEFTVYDVQVTAFIHTSSGKLELQDLSYIKALEPHTTTSIIGTITARSITKTENIDTYWTITAKNETGTIMESTMFQRPITTEPDTKVTNGELTAPVAISKVELWGPAYFVEGIDICGLDRGKSSITDAFQWVEIRNTTNEEVTIMPDWSITVTNGTQWGFAEGPTLTPRESCIIQTADSLSVSNGPGGSGGLGPPGGFNGSTVILEYSVETDGAVMAYKDSTPELSDTYGDTRNWQLIDGEWVFKNGMLPDTDRTTLTQTTEDGSVIVNLILAEEITPTYSKFRVSFIDALSQQLMNNVKFQMIFEGTSLSLNTSSVPLALVSKDNPFKREWSIDGFAENGTDTQFYSINFPGSLNITIRILGINNEPLAQALNVKFSTLATSGFPEHLQITEVELDSHEGDQWIELYNPTDRPINAPKVVLKQHGGDWATAFFRTPLETDFGKENFTMNAGTLQPHEYRVFEISSEDDSSEERFLTSRSVLSLEINEREVSRTPELTDSKADSRTWQLEGKQWVFAEATPSRAIPEFPVALIILGSTFTAIIIIRKYPGSDVN